jgi:hypothetical protein
MSIFRSTFTKEVQGQLKARQNALNNRNPQAIQQINARNAWVRMTSGVDVATKPNLASQYILQGGVLLDKKLRSGIGVSTGAYNTQTPQGSPHIRGIRPMPGITSVDIKSASAYGSLREVTVNFICHDISQLEELELLYMRPGYTVLVEWGWLPYLNNKGNIVNIVDFYDDVLKGGKDFPTILSELFQRSKQHDGNYDATYGYVKNYSWTARMDGGYDCQTTIISIGEILESLKVNVTSFDMEDRNDIDNSGLLFGERYTRTQQLPELVNNPLAIQTVTVTENVGSSLFLPDLQENYAENTLVGLLYELTEFIKTEFPKQKVGKIASITHTDLYYEGVTYDLLGLEYPTADVSTDKTSTAVKSYITLESFLQLLNNYVVLGTNAANGNYFPIVELSTKPNKYDAQDLSEEEKESLLCLAHPLQVSVDVDVCLITSPIYAKGFSVAITEALADQEQGNTNNGFEGIAKSIYDRLVNVGRTENEDPIAQDLVKDLGLKQSEYSTSKAEKFAKAFYKVAKDSYKPTINASGQTVVWKPEFAFNIINKLSNNFGTNVLTEEERKKLQPTLDILLSQSTYEAFEATQSSTQTQTVADDGTTTTTTAFNPIDYLNDMQTNSNVKKFEYGTGQDELGKIGNIYLNITNLQQLARNTDGTASEKKEIKIYDYLKKVLSQVQESIGNVNNFDIHTDPVDSNPRVIDINYTDTKSAKEKIFNNAFKIEIANTSGSVRSYNLQSQIFPEQSAMVSISAQVGSGGEQGLQNNTLLDFNRGVTDRIIAKKIDPVSNLDPAAKSDEAKAEKIKNSVIALQEYILPKTETQEDKTPDTNTSNSNKYKAALRDLIAYVQGITNSQSKNRAIIPVKISLTMDGIGGLVIGHLFQFPSELLPAGYKFDNTEVGAKLLQTVMRLGHRIENNDWTTTIEAYNIVFNNPSGTLTFRDLFKEGKLNLPTTNSTSQTNFVATNDDAKKSAEKYLGRLLSNDEWTQLVSATFAEASGNQTERAYVMGVILNRVRTNFGRYGNTVAAQLGGRNQFQAVTGTKNNPGPSNNYRQGPNKSAADSIYGAALNILPQVPKTYLSFTAALDSAYGAGTNPGFRQTLLDKGGIRIGNTIFA